MTSILGSSFYSCYAVLNTLIDLKVTASLIKEGNKCKDRRLYGMTTVFRLVTCISKNHMPVKSTLAQTYIKSRINSKHYKISLDLKP